MTAASDADERRTAAILRYLELTGVDPNASHEIFADDAVLEFPQSRERFVGTRNFLEWRKRYPADVRLTVRRIYGSGEVWVAEVTVDYDGGEPQYGVSVLEFRDDLVIHETIYGGPPREAPAWRGPWRESP